MQFFNQFGNAIMHPIVEMGRIRKPMFIFGGALVLSFAASLTVGLSQHLALTFFAVMTIALLWGSWLSPIMSLYTAVVGIGLSFVHQKLGGIVLSWALILMLVFFFGVLIRGMPSLLKAPFKEEAAPVKKGTPPDTWMMLVVALTPAALALDTVNAYGGIFAAIPLFLVAIAGVNVAVSGRDGIVYRFMKRYHKTEVTHAENS